MPSKKAIVWGCGIASVLCLVAIGAIVAVVAYFAQDVEGASISVEVPPDVVVGQTFDLKVTINNERSKKSLMLSDVDISDKYLKGFTVLSVDPKPKSNMHVPIDNSRSYTFGVQVPPEKSQVFTFTLRAEKLGMYVGDVDASEAGRYITGMAQTSVKEK